MSLSETWKLVTVDQPLLGLAIIVLLVVIFLGARRLIRRIKIKRWKKKRFHKNDPLGLGGKFGGLGTIKEPIEDKSMLENIKDKARKLHEEVELDKKTLAKELEGVRREKVEAIETYEILKSYFADLEAKERLLEASLLTGIKKR